MVLKVVCCLGLLLVLAEARRHHKHGNPDRAERKREKAEEHILEDRAHDFPQEEVQLEDGEVKTPPAGRFGDGGVSQQVLEEQQQQLLQLQGPPLKHHKGHGKKHHHPVEDSSDSVYKDQWKRITNYHKSDDDGCSSLKCRRRQVCLVNVDTGEAECVHRRMLKMRRKMKKAEGHGKADKKNAEVHAEIGVPDHFYFPEDEKSGEERRMKEHMERVKNSPEFREKEELHHRRQPKSSFDYRDRSASKKSEVHHRKANSALGVKPLKACTKQDMDEMGRRLLDWFKLLMEDSERDSSEEHPHHKTKRNSRKKELREADECICQAPVSWEFTQLDLDYNNQLTAAELQDIEDNGYEHCVRPFIDVCDHNHDMQLSQKEWCCCFADILPPCLSAQRRIPTEERNGRSQVLVGAFVPTCDKDGFFEQQQCHASTGQCWCVDRNGHEIPATRTHGESDCDKYTERYIQENL